MEKRSPGLIKFHAAQRYLVWHYLQTFLQNIRISEFPKSGGTWLGQILSDALSLDFPRNSALPMKSCIQHSHYPGPVRSKTIVVVRDGRDVMTSAYFHFLIYSPARPKWLIDKWRNKLGPCDFDNVKETMPAFIEKFTRHFSIGGKPWTWSDHIQSFDFTKSNCLCVKYEELLIRPIVELERILAWLEMGTQKPLEGIIEKYSFKNQAMRNPGQEDKYDFLRKGISGDWKNYFNNEAIQVFEKYHAKGLQYLGYD